MLEMHKDGRVTQEKRFGAVDVTGYYKDILSRILPSGIDFQGEALKSAYNKATGINYDQIKKYKQTQHNLERKR
jgi:hypothetical protein